MTETREMISSFVIGPTKSGTTLMIAMLEGHPELSIIPLEVKYYDIYFSTLKADVGYKDLNQFLLLSSKLRVLQAHGISTVEPFNTGFVDFSNVNFDLLQEKMQEHRTLYEASPKQDRSLIGSYIVDLHQAYNRALGRPQARGFAVKEGAQGLPYLNRIKEDFPAAKIIVLVRDPRDMFASRKEIVESNLAPNFVGPGDSSVLQYLFYFDHNNCFTYMTRFRDVDDGPQYHFVRYEDLVEDAESAMRDVAGFLGVEFDQSMLSPTVAGNPWGGNSSNRRQFVDVNASRVAKWQQQLNKREILLLEYYLEDYMVRWGYERMYPKTSLAGCYLSVRPKDLYVYSLSWKDFVRPYYRIGLNLARFAANLVYMFRVPRRPRAHRTSVSAKVKEDSLVGDHAGPDGTPSALPGTPERE